MGKRTAALYAGEPLPRFNVLLARDPDELRNLLAHLYAVPNLHLPRRRFQCAVLNHHQLREPALPRELHLGRPRTRKGATTRERYRPQATGGRWRH